MKNKKYKYAVKIQIVSILILIIAVSVSFSSKNCLKAMGDDGYEKVEAEISKITADKLEDIDFSIFEEQISKINGGDFFNNGFKGLVDSITKSGLIDTSKIFDMIIKSIFSKILGYIPLFSSILIILLAFGVLSQLKEGYLSEQIRNIVNVVLIISIMMVVLISVNNLIDISKDCMTNLKEQMYIAFPIILSLLHGLGAISSATSLQPILYFMSVIISDVMVGIIIPIVVFSMAINSISAISINIKLGKMSDFLKSLVKTIVGLTLTVFTACLALSGISAGVNDSIVYKTAKYAVGSSVPMIGSYLKDGMDLIIMSGIMLKNAIGISSLILFILTAITPIISVFAFSTMLKLISALTESFVHPNAVSFLDKTSKCVSDVGVALLGVTYMYFISIFVLLLVGNSFI